MMVLDYYINNTGTQQAFADLVAALPHHHHHVDTTYWQTFKMGRFRDNITVKMDDGTSFYIGLVLNSVKPEYGRVRVEANPNKVGRHQVFLLVLDWLNKHTRPMHRTVKRFDLAIDIPTDRANARLVKDGRVYSERRHGTAWTEYLGPKSSTTGRVKLYNKTHEADLDYPLTRLEITLDPAISYDHQPWPTAYYVASPQIVIGEVISMTATQRFILSALLMGYGSLNDLGRRERQRMEQYMAYYVRWVSIAESDYAIIICQLDTYLREPYSMVSKDQIISDAEMREVLPFSAWGDNFPARGEVADP